MRFDIFPTEPFSLRLYNLNHTTVCYLNTLLLKYTDKLMFSGGKLFISIQTTICRKHKFETINITKLCFTLK